MIVLATLDQIAAQSPGQGPVGTAHRPGMNMGLVCNRVHPGINDDELCPLFQRIGDVPHKRQMTGRGIGGPENNQMGVLQPRIVVPESIDQPESEITAVKTGRIIGKIIHRAKGMDEPPGIFFLLGKP